MKMSTHHSKMRVEHPKIVLVPEWAAMAVKNSGHGKEVLLDCNKLATILSDDDVLFYEYINSQVRKYLGIACSDMAAAITNTSRPIYNEDVVKYGRHLGKADAPHYWQALFGQHYEEGNEVAIHVDFLDSETLMLCFHQTDQDSLGYVFNKNSPNIVTLPHSTIGKASSHKVCELVETIFQVCNENGKFENLLKSNLFELWCKTKRGLAAK